MSGKFIRNKNNRYYQNINELEFWAIAIKMHFWLKYCNFAPPYEVSFHFISSGIFINRL